ncbi:type II toxin-antitoxin system RelE/ParE family toxin [Nitrosococcus halophilus]|uniref:type II toxin-antitoxin system RelE/ParE family toxin n=1 Tax=Nitrosococcus halophilus TaxID=133539 RepID=UPI00031C8728|nr:type II toxin-antitoxin system RelE/ParE family toxin [Nitrosococcus halophilus]
MRLAPPSFSGGQIAPAFFCRLLAEHPRLGAARPDIAPELRYLPVGSYQLLYCEIAHGIELVRVIHGARRLDQLF